MCGSMVDIQSPTAKIRQGKLAVHCMEAYPISRFRIFSHCILEPFKATLLEGNYEHCIQCKANADET